MKNRDFNILEFIKYALIPALVLAIVIALLAKGVLLSAIVWLFNNTPIYGYILLIFFCAVVFGVIPAFSVLSNRTVDKKVLKEFLVWVCYAALIGVLLSIFLFVVDVR